MKKGGFETEQMQLNMIALHKKFTNISSLLFVVTEFH
jgi:hypothetical protein